MRGINLAERAHIVQLIAPVDITGGKNSKIFSMRRYTHASILVFVGVSAAAWTKIIINQCPDITPSVRNALPFNMYAMETAGGDVNTARQAVAAAGYTPSANDGIWYDIELDSTELVDGNGPFIELQLTNGANSVIASAVAILTGPRYVMDQSPTDTTLTA